MRSIREQVAWYQPTRQKDTLLPRPHTMQKRHQGLLTVANVLAAIAADVFGLQAITSLSRLRCAACSLPRPGDAHRSR